jgi:hypothetical protein
VEAVGRARDLDRCHIRETFERRFSARRMAEKYLESYRILLGATNFTTAGLTSARRTCNSRATTGHGSPFGPSGSWGTLPKCTWNGAWYVFGIVVSSDQTPVGRASDALRAELPAVFPDFFFDFIGQEEFELEAGKPASEASHAAATRACSSGCIPKRPLARQRACQSALSACSISLGFGGWAPAAPRVSRSVPDAPASGR